MDIDKAEDAHEEPGLFEWAFAVSGFLVLACLGVFCAFVSYGAVREGFQPEGDIGILSALILGALMFYASVVMFAAAGIVLSMPFKRPSEVPLPGIFENDPYNVQPPPSEAKS